MTGREHAAIELTVSVKGPNAEATATSQRPARDAGSPDLTQECLPCSGRGLIPEDMPLSQFAAILAVPDR